MKIKPEIFISYCQLSESERKKLQGKILVYIYKILSKKGYDVSASNTLEYKDSISDFIQRMGKGQYIILLISDEYLKSKDSMSQIIEIIKNNDFKERIYPLIYSDVNFLSAEGLVEYIQFWENKKDNLSEKLKKIDSSFIKNLRDEVDLYQNIRNCISEFWNEIRNMKYLKISEDFKNLSILFRAIENQINTDNINNKKALKLSTLAISFLIAIISGISFFFIPSKTIINSDIKCSVSIDNIIYLSLEPEIENILSLKRGKYKLLVSFDEFPELNDTIELSINWFWKKNNIYIEKIEKADKLFFAKAQQANTEEAYVEYLIKFPYGNYSEIAAKLLEIVNDSEEIKSDELSDYKEIIKNPQKEKFTEFSKKYPKSKYIDALTDLFNIYENEQLVYDADAEAFNKAREANTKAAFEKYLNKFPNGKYVNEVEYLLQNISFEDIQGIEKQDYEEVILSNKLSDYEEFIEKYPNSEYKLDILDKINILKDEKAYLQALNSNKIRAFEIYIEQYPDGKYFKGASEMLEARKQIKKSKMVLIDGGTVKIGNSQKEVKIHSFYIDKYEVTVEEYRKYCLSTGKEMPEEPSWGWNDNDPIVNVSWEDANNYAIWLGKRLPTEAEWEFAAKSDYPNIEDFAWYKSNSNSMPQFVGQKKANQNGIFDILGNALEWCSDWHQNDFPGIETIDPKGPNSGTYKILKGGSWNHTNVKYSYRYKDLPTNAKNTYGFRCASD